MKYRFDHTRQGHRGIWGTTRQGMSCQPGAHRDDICRETDKEQLYQGEKWDCIPYLSTGFPNLWRANLPEGITVFLYARHAREAHGCLQALNFSGYTLSSAEFLIRYGISPVWAWRLFEVDHDRESVTQWVHHPLFLGNVVQPLQDIWSTSRLIWRLWRGCTPDDQFAVFVEADFLDEARQKIYQAALEQDLAHLDRNAIEIMSCAELIRNGESGDCIYSLFERSIGNGQRRWMLPPTFYQLPHAMRLQCLYEEAVVSSSAKAEGTA